MKHAAALALLILAGCGGAAGSQPPPATPATPDVLSRWNLFTDAPAQVPAPGVIPYETVATLFADHAAKHRFLHIPPGTTVTYDPTGEWTWPVGAIAIKTFTFPIDGGGERLIETRLWVNEAGKGFVPYVYLWNDAQTEATRVDAGTRVHVTFHDETGTPRDIDYRVPNVNQCDRCHGTFEVAGSKHEDHLLGPRTRQLDRDHDYGNGPENQIDHLASLGFFDGPVPPQPREHMVDPFGQAPIADRVHSYFEANCNHCHKPDGAAASSALFLGFTQPLENGFCKPPVSAGNGTGGRASDIVPGRPDQSIMVFRVESTDPDVKMPELPTILSDEAGAALISQWISGLTPPGCPQP